MTAMHDQDIEPNDPTRSGTTLSLKQGARLSRNEIEQLCLKAARGAGMSWGLAEEAGFAAGWLALHGIDGPGALLAQLRTAEGRPWRDICPVIAAGTFRAAPGRCLCPIALGAALCDHASLPHTAMQGAPVQIGPVSHPVLLLPFLAELARARRAPVRLAWPQGKVVITADGQISGAVAALTETDRLDASLSLDTDPLDADAQFPDIEPPFVPAAILSALNAYALRTTVPASDASRAGAGAASGDND